MARFSLNQKCRNLNERDHNVIVEHHSLALGLQQISCNHQVNQLSDSDLKGRRVKIRFDLKTLNINLKTPAFN